LLVEDGEDNPSPHAVVEASGAGPTGQPGLEQDLVGDALAPERLDQAVPVGRGVAELPAAHDVAVEATLIEERARLGTVLMVQPCVVEGDGGTQRPLEFRMPAIAWRGLSRIGETLPWCLRLGVVADSDLHKAAIPYEILVGFEVVEDLAGAANHPVGGGGHLVEVAP
jgi:hypothetical protein